MISEKEVEPCYEPILGNTYELCQDVSSADGRAKAKWAGEFHRKLIEQEIVQLSPRLEHNFASCEYLVNAGTPSISSCEPPAIGIDYLLTPQLEPLLLWDLRPNKRNKDKQRLNLSPDCLWRYLSCF